jgi:hypothetical protein
MSPYVVMNGISQAKESLEKSIAKWALESAAVVRIGPAAIIAGIWR